MTSHFQPSLDSILVSIAGFHPRGPGSIPGVGDKSVSKNWRFLFISKDKWFVKAAHSSESWDLCLKFFKNLELSLDSRSRAGINSRSEPELIPALEPELIPALSRNQGLNQSHWI